MSCANDLQYTHIRMRSIASMAGGNVSPAHSVGSRSPGIPCSPRLHKYEFRLIMLGDAHTGKTSLVLKFLGKSETEPNSIDNVTKDIVQDGIPIRLNIRDTAGMERYRSLTKSHYNGAMGALLVFDTTKEDSFKQIQNWFEDLKRYSAEDRHVQSVLVGRCHSQDSNRTVKQSEAKAFATHNDMGYIEVNVEKNENVTECFEILTDRILKNNPKLRLIEQLNMAKSKIDLGPQGESGAKKYLQNCSNCCSWKHSDSSSQGSNSSVDIPR